MQLKVAECNTAGFSDLNIGPAGKSPVCRWKINEMP